MPRILLPTFEAPPARGGIARYIAASRKSLPDAVDIVEWKLGRGYAGMLFELLLAKRHYGAIWTHHVLPIGTAAYAARLLKGLPYVVFLHGMDFDLARRNRWKQWLTRRILRRAKNVVANSHALANEIAAFAQIPKPLVVHPCVADKFIEIASEPFARQGSGQMTLLTVGRLVARKGHEKVLELLPKLPQVRYDIIGDGPMREHLLARAKSLGVADRVFINAQANDAEVIAAYRRADIFVMAATRTEHDREGFGTVYLEAQAFGIPVIAVRSPGVDEAVEDGVTGLLIDDTPEALRAAVDCLGDASLRTQFGAAGRAWILAHFTREKQFGKLRNLL